MVAARILLVDAQRETLAVRTLREHERVTAHEGRDVPRVPFAVRVNEQIALLATAEQGDRQDSVAGAGEDDRILSRRGGKFRRGQRNGVHFGRERVVRAGLDI